MPLRSKNSLLSRKSDFQFKSRSSSVTDDGCRPLEQLSLPLSISAFTLYYKTILDTGRICKKSLKAGYTSSLCNGKKPVGLHTYSHFSWTLSSLCCSSISPVDGMDTLYTLKKIQWQGQPCTWTLMAHSHMVDLSKGAWITSRRTWNM